jgi:folylpolyglutamate synthase/dihydrofolate synthase
MELLLARLGHPEEGLAVVQVAGTHGKSSVVAFLEAVFACAGLRVGVCASPDFADPAEALRFQGRPVPPSVVTALLSAALEPWEDFLFGPGKPTVYEALTAVALAHFARSQADVVLVEATTESRWDPTNFLRPRLSLLTRVEAGARTRTLAWEAACLARPGIPLLTTALEDEAVEALARGCRRSGAALVLVDPHDVELLELKWEKAVWRSRSDPFELGPFETHVAGAYQGANLSLVLAALAELFGGLPITREAIREGLLKARLPGRFEVVHARPWVVMDAAQDLAAAQALLDSLERLPPFSGRRSLLLAHLQEPLGAEMEAVLRPAFQETTRVPPGELPLRFPYVLRGLAANDFLLILGPPSALREVRDVLGSPP